MLYHAIYLSRAVRHFDDSELFALLTKARTKNETIGVTGLLLYGDTTFIQYVEGKKADVLALLDVIGKDPRHSNLIFLLKGETPFDRLFTQWSMGFHHMRYINKRGLPGLESADFDAMRQKLFDDKKNLASTILANLINLNKLL